MTSLLGVHLRKARQIISTNTGKVIKKKEYSETFVLIGIISIALFLRIFDIVDNPPGFFCDEASSGYNAYKILTTGKDEYGEALPLLFKSFGDYKSPVLIYSAVLPVALFGLNEFSVRLTSALYGVLAVLMTHFLAKEIFQKRVIGYLSSFTLAIMPWHVHLSRLGFDVHFITFFASVFLWGILKYAKKPKIGPLVLFCLGVYLGFWSYSAARISVPIILFVAVIFYPQFIKNIFKVRKHLLFVSILFTLFCLQVAFTIYDGSFMGRWQQLSGSDHRIEIGQAATTYLKYFSIDFLFTKGDAGMEGQYIKRHSILGIGELHLYQAVGIGSAIVFLVFSKKHRRQLAFILTQLAFYPIAGAIVENMPFATRVTHGSLFFSILTGVGFFILFTSRFLRVRKAKIIFTILVVTCVLINVWSYLRASEKYKTLGSGADGWQYGFRQSMIELQKRSNNFDELLISHRFNAAEVFLSFYGVEGLCPKCRVMHNPIQIDSKKKQLFSLRSEDIVEAQSRYPDCRFNKIFDVSSVLGSEPVLLGGYFVCQKEGKHL